MGPVKDRATVKVIGDVLDFDRPDLVVINGDLITGDQLSGDNGTLYVDMLLEPIVERDLTWAATYGNHDHHARITGEDILERERRFTGSRTQKMVDADDAGTSNYYLLVYPADCSGDASDCTPDLLLWFFDSRGGWLDNGDDREEWVAESVVTWFQETSKRLAEEYDKVIPSLAFVHIPIQATLRLEQQHGVDSRRQPGINEETVVPQMAAGWCDDSKTASGKCTYGGQDEPFMEALVSTPGLMSLFYGHDHGNSWCYRWDSKLRGLDIEGNGLNLCYGQHTGYGGYGNWIRGSRQVIVTQDNLKDFVVDTHILLESGDVVGAVTLNSTFGEDEYPRTPNTQTYIESTIIDSTGNDPLDTDSDDSETETGNFASSRYESSIYAVMVASLLVIAHLTF